MTHRHPKRIRSAARAAMLTDISPAADLTGFIDVFS